MLGKTFKGMTDEMLALADRAAARAATGRAGRRPDVRVVRVRPELVVEIAFDGVQTSPRYPGGVALRFARVLRYRDGQAGRRGGHDRRGPRHLVRFRGGRLTGPPPRGRPGARIPAGAAWGSGSTCPGRAGLPL